MKKIRLLQMALALIVSSGFSVVAQAGQKQTVSIQGSILSYSEYVTANGSTVGRMLFSRPIIDGVPVRSAYVSACLGPDANTCAKDKFIMVSINPNTSLSAASTTGVVTMISHKRYYDTYYIDAVSNIVPAQ